MQTLTLKLVVRGFTKPQRDDFRGYVTQIINTLDNWLKLAEVGESVEQVKELIVKDRILECVSNEVYRQLIVSKKSTVEDMLEVIEGFKSASMPAVIAREESVYVAACQIPVQWLKGKDWSVLTAIKQDTRRQTVINVCP